jgi:hypothetical protein
MYTLLSGLYKHLTQKAGLRTGTRRAKMTHKKRKSKEISCLELLDVVEG